MRIVHYSGELNFEPNATVETVPGFGSGCFFYPEGEEVEWEGRERHVFDAPPNVVEYVQEFAPFEAGNPTRVVEVFVRSEHLHLLRPAA